MCFEWLHIEWSTGFQTGHPGDGEGNDINHSNVIHIKTLEKLADLGFETKTSTVQVW